MFNITNAKPTASHCAWHLWGGLPASGAVALQAGPEVLYIGAPWTLIQSEPVRMSSGKLSAGTLTDSHLPLILPKRLFLNRTWPQRLFIPYLFLSFFNLKKMGFVRVFWQGVMFSWQVTIISHTCWWKWSLSAAPAKTGQILLDCTSIFVPMRELPSPVSHCVVTLKQRVKTRYSPVRWSDRGAAWLRISHQ